MSAHPIFLIYKPSQQKMSIGCVNSSNLCIINKHIQLINLSNMIFVCELSRLHKVYVSCYVALCYTRQPSMSTLAQEHGHPALNSWTHQPTDYLQPLNYLNVLSSLYLLAGIQLSIRLLIICK